MPFTKEEKQQLLKLQGVGETVLQRLEEVDIDSFDEIKKYEPDEILEIVCEHIQSTCWKNSPNAKNAIGSIVQHANTNTI